jgi:DNA (cytosine-5)-methyltransferase 1
MLYGSVCSGVEAATLSWHGLGWQPQFFSEIEPFCCRLLKHRFASVPNFGDLTKYTEWPDVKIDLLVGGTPCQAFSVAGLRQGLADPRGNLALVFLGLLDKYRPRWVVWENVPGVLSSSGGRDFGAFLGALAELGYGFSYRVLDAQHFGVPQRRRRVFVVGHLGNWRRAAAVLLERPSVRRGTATSGGDVSTATNSSVEESDPIAFNWMEARCFRAGPIANPLRAQQTEAVLFKRPRRLTPLECERLQGMPDSWTLIPDAKDAHRYKAIGNSMAVPVMRWIGEGIAAVNLE